MSSFFVNPLSQIILYKKGFNYNLSGIMLDNFP